MTGQKWANFAVSVTRIKIVASRYVSITMQGRVEVANVSTTLQDACNLCEETITIPSLPCVCVLCVRLDCCYFHDISLVVCYKANHYFSSTFHCAIHLRICCVCPRLRRLAWLYGKLRLVMFFCETIPLLFGRWISLWTMCEYCIHCLANLFLKILFSHVLCWLYNMHFSLLPATIFLHTTRLWKNKMARWTRNI